MRLYSTMHEALSEIRRDLYKGPKITSTRVQQRTDQELPGRELLCYSYAIEAGGIPISAQGLVGLLIRSDFPFYEGSPSEIILWLNQERLTRIEGKQNVQNELLHPALRTAQEGNWPSYTYGERMNGAFSALIRALEDTPDSRRAYWPIFRPEDAHRAGAPTRIPCSIGYQVLIRQTVNGPRLILVYSQRSADFDIFFPTDIWLAYQFQLAIANNLNILPGQFMHQITSLHSFIIEGTEVY